MALSLQPGLLLLDFDGPVCSLFSGLPDHLVAERLRDRLRKEHVEIPDHALATANPFDVWKSVSDGDPRISELAENVLRAGELDAVPVASPTPGVEEVLDACRSIGVSVVVVSNNSDDAVHAYLGRARLAHYVHDVVARAPGADFRSLKPNSHLVQLALDISGTLHSDTLMVGDSVADVEAADALDIPCVGYVAQPRKSGRLRAAGAVHEIDKIVDVLHLIAAAPTRLAES